MTAPPPSPTDLLKGCGPGGWKCETVETYSTELTNGKTIGPFATLTTCPNHADLARRLAEAETLIRDMYEGFRDLHDNVRELQMVNGVEHPKDCDMDPLLHRAEALLRGERAVREGG